MSKVEDLHVDGAALKLVHDTLKNDVGAMHYHFSTGQKLWTANIKDLTDDISGQYDFGNSGRAAVLYLLTFALVKGTETAEFHSFLNVLRRPCPRPPSDNSVFLPYLSFLCAPRRQARIVHRCHDGLKPFDTKTFNVVPPHPSCVQLPAPPHKHVVKELRELLEQYNNRITLLPFVNAIREIDEGVSASEAMKLFYEACKVKGCKPDDRAPLPLDVLIDVATPYLTMVRQRTGSSMKVKEALTWGFVKDPYYCNSPRSNSPRSPRSLLGSRLTKSHLLKASLTREEQADPNSPRFKGDYRCCPAVPDRHYALNASLGMQSQYDQRVCTPRRYQKDQSAIRAAERVAPQEDCNCPCHTVTN